MQGEPSIQSYRKDSFNWSGIGNRAVDEEAKKTAGVVRRGGVEPGSYGGWAVVTRSTD